MDWLSYGTGAELFNTVLFIGAVLLAVGVARNIARKIQPHRLRRAASVAVGTALLISSSFVYGRTEDVNTQEARSSSDTSRPDHVRLQKESFRYPEDAQPNNNGIIGPFCCTGKTVVIKATDGSIVGYAYFYGWKGQAFNVGKHSSVAPDIYVLVSAISILDDPTSPSQQGSVPFLAKEMSQGVSRSVRAGALDFKVTILQATQVSFGGSPFFEMGSLSAQLDVSVADGKAPAETVQTPVVYGTSTAENVELQKDSFRFPEDGQPNNNGRIGPFCCTGRTVTIKKTDGNPVGYAYFYSWTGQAYNTSPKSSAAPSINILVSSLADLSDTNSPSQQGSISFLATEMLPGASRSARVGGLEFKVTILEATQVNLNGGTYFDMGSVKAQLDAAILKHDAPK
jgi:hypothetical protein